MSHFVEGIGTGQRQAEAFWSRKLGKVKTSGRGTELGSQGISTGPSAGRCLKYLCAPNS